MSAHSSYALLTLGVALLFAAIFLFGGRVAYRPGQSGRRRFLSFAAGISVGYTFVHVLPALGKMRDLTMQSPHDFRRLFPEYSVYLWTMAGFLAFYCLQAMVARPRSRAQGRAGEDVGTAPWQRWVHIGGFALYAWLLSYLMLWKGRDALALCLYGMAMSMHILPIACNLSSEYREAYDRRGAYLLALASLAGWAAGLALDIPAPLLVNLVAVVAGGVILNTLIAELPKEREGRYGYFVAGATFYSVVLLVLSHFEEGG